MPDANTEYLLYQTLVGVWPLEAPDAAALEDLRQRVRGYMEKAVKEAKVHTAWTNADSEYEATLMRFTESIIDPERNGAFFADFLPFQRRIARLGLFNSLSQTLLRLTAPGVPDIYQGSELWSLSLVDPDNRRPVDFALRRSLLASLQEPLARGSVPSDWVGSLVEHLPDGRAKLYLISRALDLRRANPELFELGEYNPLPVEGEHAERLCAYARTHAGRCVIALAPRLLAPLAPSEQEAVDPFTDGGWSSTLIEVPSSSLQDALSGVAFQATSSRGRNILSAAEVLRRFPVGLLISKDTSHA